MNSKATTIDISIIILAKNEEKRIGSTLDMVFSQEIDRNFEVIVIDSGSKDMTSEIIKNYAVKIVNIEPREFGHGKTRNLGAGIARGKYIVFLNGDASPRNRRWLSSLLFGFSQYDKVAAIYSKIYPRQDCNPLDARDILSDDYLFDENNKEKYINSPFKYARMDAEKKRKFISFHTISCAIDKKILLDNSFSDISFGEDLEWSKRTLEKGYKIIFEPKSEVIHSHNIHLCFIKTIKKYYDDTSLNQRILKRWNALSLLKLPLVVFLKSIRDILYIRKIKKRFIYKTGWLIYSPLIRITELIGILLGAFPYMPKVLMKRLSLVEEIKR